MVIKCKFRYERLNKLVDVLFIAYLERTCDVLYILYNNLVKTIVSLIYDYTNLLSDKDSFVCI